jgi:hypothetical protein
MTGFTEKGFVERARAKGGEAVVLDVEKAGLAGGSWTWSQMGRMVCPLRSSPSSRLLIKVLDL